MALKEADIKKYEQLLNAKKRELLEELGIIQETHIGTSIKEATGDLSSYSYHMADQGTETMDREMAFMMASKQGRLIYHIDEALRRLKDGTFGACQSCGKHIGVARLEAVPHARLCIDCKSKEEEAKTGKA